jgi:hypothetical protein
LIDLSLVASNLKLSKDVDEAIKYSEESIANLKFLNKGGDDMGIASQNLVEELYDNLQTIKAKDLDVDEPSVDYSLMRKGKAINPDLEELMMLTSIRKGNKIVATKEYMLVFYITCFVPFIRPNLP